MTLKKINAVENDIDQCGWQLASNAAALDLDPSSPTKLSPETEVQPLKSLLYTIYKYSMVSSASDTTIITSSYNHQCCHFNLSNIEHDISLFKFINTNIQDKSIFNMIFLAVATFLKARIRSTGQR